jgi:hypothetical protein
MIDLSRPDVLYPSTDYDIPVLDLGRAARGIDLPVLAWGSFARTRRIDGGMVHFYVNDMRFSALWARPSGLAGVGVRSAVEANFSIWRDTPRAFALAQIYRKRYLARRWQDLGVDMVVDMFVPPNYLDVALLGVPAGWPIYATRGVHGHGDITVLQYEAALARAGAACVFCVVGGGLGLQQLARDRGWVWVPDYYSGRVVNG